MTEIIKEINKINKLNCTKGVKETLINELKTILKLSEIINENFYKIVDEILKIKGKVIVTGMGKSGLIGKKIAATLASTGTPSFFVHPGEAFHGDLGMITKDDIVVMISNSGNTEEVVKLMPVIKKYIGSKIIGITGNPNSILAKESDYKLLYEIKKEGYLNLPPMASTTAQLVIGDLIATALMEKRGFKKEDFALFHPGGTLGKKLLLSIENIFNKIGVAKEKVAVYLEDNLKDVIV